MWISLVSNPDVKEQPPQLRSCDHGCIKATSIEIILKEDIIIKNECMEPFEYLEIIDVESSCDTGVGGL